jgi:hypothetical protein
VGRRAWIGLVVGLGLAVAGPARADVPGPAHDFAVTRAADPGLPGHTVIRPSDLTAVGFKLPIVIWGNGGCRNSNEEFRYFLTRLAALGYFVVANGPPENPYNSAELLGILDPQAHKLTDALNWSLKQNALEGGPYYDALDPTRVVMMGQSCGGWEAVDASADARVRTTIVWNNGGDPHAGNVAKLHAPTLFVSGGFYDYTLAEAVLGYTFTPSTVPAAHADYGDGGHTGLWDDPPAPQQPPNAMQREPPLVAAQWLAMTLYGDPVGRAFFLGSGCGLCSRKGWTLDTKNWSAFDPPPSQAPPRAVAPAVPACVSRRVVVLHPRARRVRSVAVYVNGTLLRRQRAAYVRVDLSGRPRGTARVRLVATLASGRHLVDRRSYRLCGG